MKTREKIQITGLVVAFLSMAFYKVIENRLEKTDPAIGIPIIIGVGVAFFGGFFLAAILQFNPIRHFRWWRARRRIGRMQESIIRARELL